MRFRAILFDLDGTLVDSERAYGEAMARALRRGLALEIRQQDRDFIVGRSWVAIHEHLCRVHRIPWSRDQLIAATCAERAGAFADPVCGARVLPGALDAVARVAHLPLGVVTGSSREEAAGSLDWLGLREAFRVVIASEDVPRSKPDPDGYLAAAAALGVAPADCLVVEDSTAGIAAGLAAGATVVAVAAGNFSGHDQSAAHRRIATLEELTLELLAAL